MTKKKQIEIVNETTDIDAFDDIDNEKTLIRRQKIRTKRKLFIMIYRIESLPD